ncbi:unnamed protein product, partial [Ixodes persulcatus]
APLCLWSGQVKLALTSSCFHAANLRRPGLLRPRRPISSGAARGGTDALLLRLRLQRPRRSPRPRGDRRRQRTRVWPLLPVACRRPHQDRHVRRRRVRLPCRRCDQRARHRVQEPRRHDVHVQRPART